MPTSKNAVLAYTALDSILANPKHHDQGSWVAGTQSSMSYTLDRLLNTCGTTACFAGWTVLTAGDTLLEERAIRDAEGTPLGRFIPARALELLRIDWDDAGRLFYDAENVDELVEAVQDVFGPDPRIPDDPSDLFQSGVAWYTIGEALTAARRS